jgi:hypothetical protein
LFAASTSTLLARGASNSSTATRAHFVGAHRHPRPPSPPPAFPPPSTPPPASGNRQLIFVFSAHRLPQPFTLRRASFPTANFVTTTPQQPPRKTPHHYGYGAMDHCAAVLLLFPESFSNDLPDPEYHKAARQHVQKVENLSKDGLLAKFAPQLLPVSPPRALPLASCFLLTANSKSTQRLTRYPSSPCC